MFKAGSEFHNSCSGCLFLHSLALFITCVEGEMRDNMSAALFPSVPHSTVAGRHNFMPQNTKVAYKINVAVAEKLCQSRKILSSGSRGCEVTEMPVNVSIRTRFEGKFLLHNGISLNFK
jgi:hypothetical protein